MKKFMKFRVIITIVAGILAAPAIVFAVVQSLNGATGNTQTFVSDSNIIITTDTGANTHSLGWNGRLPISRGGTGNGSFTTGSVLFASGASISQDNTNLFWDDTNNRLGVGTNAPSQLVDANGTVEANQFSIDDTGSSNNISIITSALTASRTVTLPDKDLTLDWGTYTPTLTDIAHIESSTAYQAQYMRVGNTVTVSGKVDITRDATFTGNVRLGISLPVASNFGAEEDCAGTTTSKGNEVEEIGESGIILADDTNNRAELQYDNGEISSQSWFFQFTYQVLP
jgi:hypothetical protein